MNLASRFIDSKIQFSSYDEFHKGFRLKIPRDFNFVRDVVDVYAQQAPNKTALIWCDDEGNEKTFTFKELSRQIRALAASLALKGIKKGNVVMLALHRRYEYWLFVLALNILGAVVLPVPSQLHAYDFKHRIQASDAKMVVAAPFQDCINQLEKAAAQIPVELVSVNFEKEGWTSYKALKALVNTGGENNPLPDFDFPSPEAPMIMYYTSGTTDKPKLVVHDGFYPLSHIITAKYWQCVKEDGLHYSAAETGWAKASWGKLYGQWIMGCAVFVYDRQSFNPEALLEKIQKYRVTSFCATPTLYRYLLNADFSKYDLSSLEHCTCAGEALSENIYKGFLEKTGLRIYEGYGQTETSLLAANFCFSGSREAEDTCGSMGRFSPLYDLVLLDENDKECEPGVCGEIAIKLGKSSAVGLMQAGFNSEYYRTGDLAVKDNDGRLWFSGRNDNIIKSSGFRISPLEIESVLQKHPCVSECLVYGENDEQRGQVVKALVVPAHGCSTGTALEQELMNFMHKETALYKCPRKIEFVKSLPKTYNGKIRRFIHNDEK